MQDKDKTRKQLIEELQGLRERLQVVDALVPKQEEDADPDEGGLQGTDRRNLFETILDSLVTGIWVTDAADRIRYANRGMGAIAGMAPEEMKGLSVFKDFPRETIRHFELFYRKAKETLKAVPYSSVPVRTPAGRDSWQSGWILPLVRKGRWEGAVCTTEEDRRARLAEEQLRESEAKFGTIFRSSPEAIVITSVAEGRFVEVNKSFERVTGYGREEVIGRTTLEVGIWWDAADRARMIEALRRHGEIYDQDFRYRSRGGRKIDTLVSAEIIDLAGTPCLLAQIRDITGRKREERALTVMNRLQEVFLTVAGDDVYANLLDVLLEAVDSPIGFFAFIDDEGNLVSPSLTREVWDQCRMSHKSIVFPRETWTGLWGESLLQGRTHVTNDGLKTPPGHISLSRAICVPVLFQETVIGQFALANKGIDYDAHDQALLERIAAFIGPILKAHLERKKEEREREKAERSLLESRERMSQALRAANAGAWEWRKQTNEAIWSDENYLVLGLEPGSVPARYENWLGMLHPEDRAEADRLVTEAVVNRTDLDIAYRVVWPDGSIRWINDLGRLVYDESGEPRGMYGIQIDISERRQAREELRRKEEYYRSLFENAMDIVTIMGADGTILFESPSVERIVGYRPDELIGLDAFTLIHPEDAAPIREIFERAVKHPGAVERGEFRFQHRDGSWRTLEAVGKNLLHLPAVGAVVINLRDVTDRRMMERQLRKSLQEKEILLREIHHRVKNNLQIISSLLDLQAGTVNTPEILNAFRDSRQRVKTMSMIHERLYGMGDVSSIMLAGFVEDLVHAIVRANSTNVAAGVHCDIPEISVSPAATVPCGLIINELVSNSLKHAFAMGRSGNIRIRVRSVPENRLALIVADDGTGLPGHVDIHQPDSLGLNIVKALVRQLKGTMTVRSCGGTEMEVVFPNPPPEKQG
ncbi:PAS domain S-box protein [Desulfococcus sp.]|uniref:PAS domain S-box protein n=1 Tax=Desulfococcus sp. TaxID=2025834 RepID=UPI003593712A